MLNIVFFLLGALMVLAGFLLGVASERKRWMNNY